MTTGNPELCASQGATADIVKLLSLYGQLNSDAKGNLLCAAASALAEQHVRGLKNPDGSTLEAYDWLTRLAKDAYPKIDIAAELLALAENVEPEWESYVFPDGWLAPILCLADDVFGRANQIYWGYMSIREDNDADCQMPEPTRFFGIKVPKDTFGELTTDKGWVFDEVEWKDEVQNQCTQKFALFLHYWRRKFFKALLEGQSPTHGR